jgi:hypothetical protein
MNYVTVTSYARDQTVHCHWSTAKNFRKVFQNLEHVQGSKTFRKFLCEIIQHTPGKLSERNFRKETFGKFLKLERVQDFEKLSESFWLLTNDNAQFGHVRMT